MSSAGLSVFSWRSIRRYLRSTEVELLLGDATKVREALGWTPSTTFDQLIDLMTDSELARDEAHVRKRS